MNRRVFMHWCSVGLSGLVAAFLLIPGGRFLLDPVFRQGKKGGRHRLLKLADLTIGEPRKMVVTDRRVDAWTRYPEGPIGAVWLNRRDETNVDAFAATCPHLGCPVDYSTDSGTFVCPCHAASFADDGSILAGPQQRGMDRLDLTIETVDGEDWISVLFERFELGTPEQTPLA